MVFSEPTFVFLFLPFVVIAYLALGREGIYLLVLLGSIAMNHLFGLAIAARPSSPRTIPPSLAGGATGKPWRSVRVIRPRSRCTKRSQPPRPKPRHHSTSARNGMK